MKEWFLAKSLAVKILLSACALGVVAAVAGTSVYFATVNKTSDAPNAQVVSIGEDEIPTTDAPDVKEEKVTSVLEEPEEEATTVDKTVEAEEVVEEETEEYRPKEGYDFVNGNFSEGLYGYEVYAVNADYITYATDENGFHINIDNTGSEDWHVQLKQNDVRLLQGRWYRLSLNAKSSVNRTVTTVMQRNGLNDDNWTPYSPTMKLDLTNSWKGFSTVFKMNDATDNAVFNLSMGAVDGKQISTSHEIDVKNIRLELLPVNFTDTLKVGGNLIGNADFSYGDVLWEGSVVAPGQAAVSFKDNKASFDIANPGTVDWHVQLKQQGIALEKNAGYTITFNVSSSAQRTIKVGVMDTNYINWYGGADLVVGPGTSTVSVKLYNSITADPNAVLMISMGQIEGVSTPASTVTMSNFSMVKDASVTASSAGTGSAPAPVGNPTTVLDGVWEAYDHECAHTHGSYVDGENGFKTSVVSIGSEAWHVQLTNKTLQLEKGKTYRISFEAKSSIERNIQYMVQKNGGDWAVYSDAPVVAIGPEWTNYEQTFVMAKDTDLAAIYNFSLGKVDEKESLAPHNIWIKNIVFEEVVYNGPEKTETGYIVKSSHDMTTDEYGSKWIINLDPKDYGIESPEGKNLTISMDLASEGDFNGLIGACYTNNWAWKDTGAVDATNNAHWTFDVDDFKGALQIQINSMTGEMVEITNLTIVEKAEEEEPKEPEEEDYVRIINADTPKDANGNYEIELPYDSSLVGKKVRVDVVLESDDYFNGQIGGCNTPSWAWTDTGKLEAADGKATWTYEFYEMQGALKLQIFWKNAEVIKVKSVTCTEVVEEPAPEETVVAVITDDSLKNEGGNYQVEFPVDDSFVTKNILATVEMESDGEFNGMLGSCFGENWGWTATGQLFSDNGNAVWQIEVEDFKGALQVQIFWKEEGSTITIKKVTVEEIVAGPAEDNTTEEITEDTVEETVESEE